MSVLAKIFSLDTETTIDESGNKTTLDGKYVLHDKFIDGCLVGYYGYLNKN